MYSFQLFEILAFLFSIHEVEMDTSENHDFEEKLVAFRDNAVSGAMQVMVVQQLNTWESDVKYFKLRRFQNSTSVLKVSCTYVILTDGVQLLSQPETVSCIINLEEQIQA